MRLKQHSGYTRTRRDLECRERKRGGRDEQREHLAVRTACHCDFLTARARPSSETAVKVGPKFAVNCGAATDGPPRHRARRLAIHLQLWLAPPLDPPPLSGEPWRRCRRACSSSAPPSASTSSTLSPPAAGRRKRPSSTTASSQTTILPDGSTEAQSSTLRGALRDRLVLPPALRRRGAVRPSRRRRAA